MTRAAHLLDRAGHALVLGTLLGAALLGGCGDRPTPASPAPTPHPEPAPSKTVHLVLAAFATPYEAYENRILPEFQKYWLKTHGQKVDFTPSYGGSGSQARAIVQGLEVDVAALSLAPDLDEIAHAGLIRGDWRSAPHAGVVSRSLVAFAVRKGNPLGIRGWPDLLSHPGRPYSVVTPDPKSSGGGRWNLCAAYGAALRDHAGVRKDDPGSAQTFLGQLVARVEHWDKDARESFKTFEAGAGDVAITSESEVIRGRMFGHDYELVLPRSTLRIDNPVAVVDVYAEKHGVAEVARGFVEYLWTRDAQRAYAFYGFRPVDEDLAAENVDPYPRVEDLWTIEELGGWERISKDLFGASDLLEKSKPSPSDR